MSETNTTTRRSALAKMALAAGGAIGLGVAGGKVVADRNESASTAAPRPRRAEQIVLHGADWRLTRPGVAPGTLPSAEAFAVPTGRILDGSKRDLGTFRAAAIPGLGGAFLLHTFDLEDGTILGIGASRLDEADFAIVGGTGRYAGATGTYSAHQSPREAGGDGTARFTLDIKALEA